MTRFFLTTVIIIITIAAGCKAKKAVTATEPESPYTDTIKIAVNYQLDSLELFVKKIIVNDSLYALRDESYDYSLFNMTQKDSLLYITIQSYKNCSDVDFDLYQSTIVLKTYPPRIRCRFIKTRARGCEERLAYYTAVFDLRPLLKEYAEAYIMFNGSGQVAHIKRQ